MRKKLKLTSIELETKDGKKVTLTIEEAKELHEQLDSLFGDKTVYLPSTPIYIDRWHPPYRPYWGDTTCKLEGKSGMTVSYNASDV